MTPLFYFTAFIAVLASASHGLAPSELDLLDIVLVASVDGKFHVLNRTLQSMSSFPSLTSFSAPSTLAPLVRTAHLDRDTDVTATKELYVVEPQSGDIYVMAMPTSPLQRFPLSVAEINDMSPFSFDGAEERIFLGRKERLMLSIELETGKIKTTFDSECRRNQAENEGTDQSKTSISTPTEVCISRTDKLITFIPGSGGLLFEQII